MRRVIGIDFGTSTSILKVKMYRDDYSVPQNEMLEYKSVTFESGSVFVPTLIRKGGEGTEFYGNKAVPFRSGTTLFSSFKVDLQSQDEEKQRIAKELTKEYFCYLFSVYHSQKIHGLIGDIDAKEETLVSYPVKWSDEIREFMIEAAEEAGFVNVRGMDEAEAAIKASVLQNTHHLQKLRYGDVKVVKIMMIDMGAGTTDLAIGDYDIAENKFDVKCVYPTKDSDKFFGGHEIDTCLAEYIKTKTDPAAGGSVINQLLANESFKEWKENTVSPTLADRKTVDCFGAYDMCVGMAGIPHEDYAFGRKQFESIFSGYLGNFPKLVNECIGKSGINKSDIDLVVLTGGHSQWYFVKEMLCDAFDGQEAIGLEKIKEMPERILCLPCPQETVSLGLVYSKLPTVISGTEERTEQPVDAFGKLHREEFYKMTSKRVKLQLCSILEDMNPQVAALLVDGISMPFIRREFSFADNDDVWCAHKFDDKGQGGKKICFALTDKGIYCNEGEGVFISWWDYVNGDIVVPSMNDTTLSCMIKGKRSVVASWGNCEIPRIGFMIYQIFLLVQENIWNIKKKTRTSARKRLNDIKKGVSNAENAV